MRLPHFLAAAPFVVSLAACSIAVPHDDEGSAAPGDDALTGTTSAERGIHFEGYVYVTEGTGDDAIGVAIARQVKTAIGALRSPKVSLNDRAARANLDPSKWTRTSVDVVEGGVVTKRLVKVGYRYDDRAVVTNALAKRSTVDFTMLFDDYTAHAEPLKTSCTDDPTTDTDSLWYHYEPQRSTCRAKIQAESEAIAAEAKSLAKGQIGAKEAARWFLPVTAKLDPAKLPDKPFSPEYDRLFGVGTDKSQLVIYAFHGVDHDENDPDDVLAQEAARFLRSLLRGNPNFRPVHTAPFTWLLDFWVDGKKLDGITYDRMLGWILDRSGYPAEVGSDPAKIEDLRRQALAKLTERWIYWDLPVSVKDGAGNEKRVTVEVRSFYGYEDGSWEARQHAEWRYLEAMWHGDVFLYDGHSHFGHGPLEPTLYGPQNLNDRYQIMLVNSCISFNYYHQDFLDMKPGGSKNLDMIVNGLPSWVWGGGEVLARMVNGLVSGEQPSYAELLSSMRLDTPWGERGYDPMRVADGELDNVYDARTSPLTITALPPVYP